MTETSSQTCYICECKPKSFNDIKIVKKRQKKTENYKFKLSALQE